MPYPHRYKQKITRLMTYAEFRKGLARCRTLDEQAFLSVLFFYGCRISEALALTPLDIAKEGETLYIAFKRLKGSHQTDPVERPATAELDGIFSTRGYSTDHGRLFPFSRMTGYRIVKRAFPKYYPHFFRMNSISTTLEMGGSILDIKSDYGLSLGAIDHYIGQGSQRKVGQLWKSMTVS